MRFFAMASIFLFLVRMKLTVSQCGSDLNFHWCCFNNRRGKRTVSEQIIPRNQPLLQIPLVRSMRCKWRIYSRIRYFNYEHFIKFTINECLWTVHARNTLMQQATINHIILILKISSILRCFRKWCTKHELICLLPMLSSICKVEKYEKPVKT